MRQIVASIGAPAAATGQRGSTLWRMRPFCRSWPLAVLLLLLAGTSAVLPAAGDTSRTRQPYQGVTLIERVLTTPRLALVHLAQVDLRAPGVRVAVSPPAGARERESIWNAVAGSAQIVTSGRVTVPTYRDDAHPGGRGGPRRRRGPDGERDRRAAQHLAGHSSGTPRGQQPGGVCGAHDAVAREAAAPVRVARGATPSRGRRPRNPRRRAR